MTWQEAAVSSELFAARKAPLGAANKNFRGIVGSVGAPRPSRPAEGARLPLSKHRGVMWLSNVGTGCLG